MPTPLLRVLALVGTSLVVVGVAFGVVWFGTSCADKKPATSAKAPTPEASPEEVVRTFLQAVGANDHKGARRQTRPEFTSFEDWMRNTRSISDVLVRPAVVDNPKTVAVPAGLAQAQAAYVRVEFRRCSCRGAFASDGTREGAKFADGTETWGYGLVRDRADGGPWLIFDEGQ